MKNQKYDIYKELMKTAGNGSIHLPMVRWFAGLVIFELLLIGIGVLYHLHWFGLFILVIAGLICIPVVLMNQVMQQQENKRFNEVDIYVHQMAYSFERNPKINIALEDTQKVLSGKMYKTVEKAIHVLQYSEARQVYEEALGIIETAYPCPQISTLHRFLIHIEEKGGSYRNALEVLLTDFDRWTNRIYKYQQDIRQVKRNSLIGIMLSCMLASASVFISFILQSTSEINLDISKEWMYQIISVLFIILNMVYFTYIQVQYNCNWLESKRTQSKIQKDYHMVFGGQSKTLKNFSIFICIIGILLSWLVGFVVNRILGIMLAGMAVYILFVPSLNKKHAFARLQEDVYMAFSEWLRDVVINLQDEPLQAAVEETYSTCPAVMKASLGRFILALEASPADVRAYYDFMSEFQILDICSTVKTLYSVSELESESIDRTMNTLIRRNYEIVDKHEKMRNQDNISMLRFGEYIPMVFVSMKIAVDMLLIITNYL